MFLYLLNTKSALEGKSQYMATRYLPVYSFFEITSFVFSVVGEGIIVKFFGAVNTSGGSFTVTEQGILNR